LLAQGRIFKIKRSDVCCRFDTTTHQFEVLLSYLLSFLVSGYNIGDSIAVGEPRVAPGMLFELGLLSVTLLVDVYQPFKYDNVLFLDY
jgi:hypothetical protein